MTDGGARLPAVEDLARLVQLSLDLLCIATPDGRFAWVSPAFTRVLGHSQAELTSVSFLDLLHPDDVAPTRAALVRLEAGESLIGFRNRYRHADGRWVWLEWNGAPMVAGHLYTTARDITEEVARAAQIRRQTEGLLLGESLAGVGHWAVDLADQSLHWSPEIFRIHGLAPETFSPTVEAAIERYHPEDRQRVADDVQRAVETGEGFDFQLRVVRPDGEIRHVVSKGRVQDDDAGPGTLFGVFQDVTDQLEIQQRLLITERMASIGTLAAGIGHEINNPLTYVMANLELLTEQIEREVADEAGAQANALIAGAMHGAMRVRKIVRNLKSFGRADVERRRPLVLREVVASAVEMAQHELRHRARLEVDIGPEVSMVHGDEARLGQVFINLIVNAVHAIEEAHVSDGRISIRARGAGDEVCVEIADNGVGLSEATRARIFEPFFTTKPQGVGTGLGLSISLRIIEDMGGTLEVRSNPGDGATFTVRLPAFTGVPESVGPDHTPALGVALPRARVVVVDDEPYVRQAAQNVLKAEFEVEVCEGARQTLTMLEHDANRDALLIDVMMPELTGVELYRVVSERWPHLRDRVVFITGGAFTPDARRFLDEHEETGLISVLEKPFNVKELRRAVARTVARGRGDLLAPHVDPGDPGDPRDPGDPGESI